MNKNLYTINFIQRNIIYKIDSDKIEDIPLQAAYT